MSTGLLAQYLVIAFAVLTSAGYVVQRQWPGLVRRLRVALAVPLVRAERPDWVQRCGRWLAPTPFSSGSSACGGCDENCKSGSGKRH